jgi:FKBP-type peptidyl-prolyl cis-trans isomerase FklB
MIRKDVAVMRGFAGMLGVAVATGVWTLAAQQPPSNQSTSPPKAGEKKQPEFQSLKEKASFVIGLNLGQQILKDFGRGDAVDTDQFVKGLKAGLGGDQTFDRQGMLSAILEYRLEVIKEDAGKFLAENKKKEGVKTTASGLQYQVLTSGSGKSPTTANRVKVHYTGTLVNGNKFDSSHDTGQPAEFALTEVVAGWTEVLQLMKEGDKWRVFIPPELGYKAKGRPPKIPPHAVLIFEMELIEVK